MSDTIAAVATAKGSAALGIIRISGSTARDILLSIVPGTRAVRRPRVMLHGLARDLNSGVVIDEVMCFFAPGPSTATGEDVAEIHGHGGVIVLETLLAAALEAGARAANPGEFTYRAFRNGRMDLTQAEAVMSLIGAGSQRAAKTAIKQLAGGLGAGLGKDYDTLTTAAAQLEAGLDFPDEDLPLKQSSLLASKIEQTADRLTASLETFKLGHRLTEGASVVLAGPSNAGKSSLFNKLVKEERALVDDKPGTTRDVVEARFQINGIPIVFMDTAGLRNAPDRVERHGMERSKGKALQADLLLLVLDGSNQDASLSPELSDLLSDDIDDIIVVWNKNDLISFAKGSHNALNSLPSVSTSTVSGDGISELISMISTSLSSTSDTSEIMLTTARQHAAVSTAAHHARRAASKLRSSGEIELATTDVRWAREALASLWGRSASDEVIDKIFSSFCLGK